MSKQPRDDGNEAIPVLGLRANGGHLVPFTTGASNTSPQISASIRVVTLYADQDAFIETGASSVSANQTTSHFLPSSIPYDISLGAETDPLDNNRYVAIIGSTAAGTLYISERE
jgi:hypothetical protein